MKTMQNLKKSAGFTLVELLIVIIIIGILAGAMMMMAGSGSDKAEATKIISDLRGLKAASLMYYADNNGFPSPTNDVDTVLGKYMDKKVGVKYFIVSGDDAAGTERLLVGYGDIAEGVRTSLGDPAPANSGLIGSAANPPAALVDPYDENEYVWMIIK